MKQLVIPELRSSRRQVPVTYANERARQRLAASAGLTLTDTQVAWLGGALPGSRVEVTRFGQLLIHGPDGTRAVVYVCSEDESGARTLFDFSYQNHWGDEIPMRAEMLQIQATQARALGIVSIHIKCRSGTDDFETLPRMGCSALLDAHLVAETRTRALPVDIPTGTTLLELVSTPAGAAWWHLNGEYPGLDFDTRPGSASMKTLSTYLRSQNEGQCPMGSDKPTSADVADDESTTTEALSAKLTPIGLHGLKGADNRLASSATSSRCAL
jgi:hypothetical protein